MIALDTNVLLRLLTGDDPVQAEAARKLITTLTPAAPAFVARESMQELVWVLERTIGIGRAEIVAAVEGLLGLEVLSIECSDRVTIAITRYAAGGPGFADQMIMLAAGDAGATLMTFDQRLAKRPGAALMEL